MLDEDGENELGARWSFGVERKRADHGEGDDAGGVVHEQKGKRRVTTLGEEGKTPTTPENRDGYAYFV